MIWGILLFCLGLAFGSFVNVLLYRLPKGENFINSRSRCPECSFKLEWFDLIPVLSYVWLQGRCRSCKKNISPGYPLIELSFGGLAVLIFAFFGADFGLTFFWVVIAMFLLTLFLFDIRYFILPDLILVWMAVFVVLFRLLTQILGTGSSLVPWNQALIGGLILTLFLGTIWFISGGRWLGFGDVKYGFVIGLIFGVSGGIFVLYLAVIIGGLIGLGLLVGRKADRKTKLPLGAFISLAALVYILGQGSIDTFISRLFL